MNVAEHEILLVLTEDEYRRAGERLEVLRERGAGSNTQAILDALKIAASLTSTDPERTDHE